MSAILEHVPKLNSQIQYSLFKSQHFSNDLQFSRQFLDQLSIKPPKEKFISNFPEKTNQNTKCKSKQVITFQELLRQQNELKLKSEMKMTILEQMESVIKENTKSKKQEFQIAFVVTAERM